jgi:hypothetical protein
MSNTSEFSVPEPFAPKPRSHADESATGLSTDPEELARATQRPVNVGLIIVAAATAGFALGYALSRYEQSLQSQSRLDDFLDNAGDWFREQGPKITEPIKQGFETTSTTVGQALKDVAASAPKLEQLNPFRAPKRKPVFGLF